MQIVLLEKNIAGKNTNADFIKYMCDFFEIKPYELYGINILRILPDTKEELGEIIDLLKEEYDKWEE